MISGIDNCIRFLRRFKVSAEHFFRKQKGFLKARRYVYMQNGKVFGMHYVSIERDHTVLGKIARAVKSFRRNVAHVLESKIGNKLSPLRKYYFTELLVILILVGSVGVYMTSFGAATRSYLPIPYQGRLMDASYVPKADGTYYLAFEIYDALTNGTCKWRTEVGGTGACDGSDIEAITTTVSRGLFNVALGDGTTNVNPQMAENFNTASTSYYLQVRVCTSAAATSCETLSPRKQLGGVLFSYNSDMLDGLDSSSFIAVGATATHTGDTTDGLTISATSLTTGSALVITGPSGGSAGVTDAILKIASDVGALGGSNGLISSTATVDSTTGMISSNLYLSTTNNATSSANTVYGAYNTVSDTSTYANTDYGMYINSDNSAAHTSGTKEVYGLSIAAQATGSNGGNTNVYGLHITGRTVQGSNDGSTANYYGLYIDNNEAGNQTYATSTKYALYVESPTGADTNYAAIFAGGNVGIGTVTPSGRLHSLESGAKTTANYAGYIENTSTNTNTDSINKYGLYITSTGSFTGSSGTATNNYGIYVDTTSGGDNNYSAYFVDKVGIGTIAPNNSLLTILTGSVELTEGHINTPYGGFGQFQNYLLRSEEFDNSTWNTGPDGVTVTANNVVGPDNSTSTAEKLLDATAAGTTLTQLVSGGVSTSQTWTFSIWLKNGNATGTYKITLTDDGSSATTDTTTITASANTSWQRFSVTHTTAATGTTNVTVGIDLNQSNNDTSYIYAWGAQLEISSSAHVYVPTSTLITAVTTTSYGLVIPHGVIVLTNSGSYSATIKPSASMSTAWTFTLPTDGGTNNYYLKTDGSGTTSWGDPTSSSNTMTFLDSGSGSNSSTSTGITLDSVNITTPTFSYLTAADTLVVYFNIRSDTAATTQMALYDNVANVRLAWLNNNSGTIAANGYAAGQVILRRAAEDTQVVYSTTTAFDENGSDVSTGARATSTTAWNGSSSLTLDLRRVGAVDSGGTTQWSWAAYMIAGQ